MLTVILLLAASIAMPQVQPSIPAVKNGDITKHTGNKKAEDRQKQTPIDSPQIVCNDCPVKAQPSSEVDKEKPYDPTQDTLYRFYLISTIVGVLIALGGICILLRQNRQIRTQTEHLEKQIAIQQRSSRQWVNVIEWRHERSSSRQDTLELFYRIENPTPIPLRLDMVMSKTNGSNGGSGLVTFLVPDNPFPCDLSVILNPEQLLHFHKGDLVLNVEISVFFTDAFDNQWNQIFQRILVCGPHTTKPYVRQSRTRMRRSGPNDPQED